MGRQGKIQGLVWASAGSCTSVRRLSPFPFDQVQWMSNQEVQASSNANQGGYGTNTAGGVTVPSTATGGTGQPTTIGSTASGGAGGMTGGTTPAGSTATTGGTAGSADHLNAPARAKGTMTKADLRNAPEFRYSTSANRAGASGNPNLPSPNVNTLPATARQTPHSNRRPGSFGTCRPLGICNSAK